MGLQAYSLFIVKLTLEMILPILLLFHIVSVIKFLYINSGSCLLLT